MVRKSNDADFKKALQKAIDKSLDNNDIAFADKLEKILAFLPKYPVMAMLEAESAGMSQDFIKELRKTYSIRGLK